MADQMMEHKAVPVGGVEVLDEDQGIVAAIVSVTGLVDRVKDNIEPGAYTKTLKSRTPKGIWHHNWKEPVSKTLEIKEMLPGDPGLPKTLSDGKPWPAMAGALRVVTQFNLEGDRGRQAFADVKFFGAEQEWCADAETEILTDRGWLSYDEVQAGDQAYVLDPDFASGRFETITDVNVWPQKVRSLRHIEVGGHSSLTTAAHRWPVQSNRDGGRLGWSTTENLGVRDGFIRAAARMDAPEQPKYSDAFVELVAWFWTEGWVPPASHSDAGLYMAQSTKANPQHAAAIRVALEAAFEGEWSERHSIDDMARFRLRREAANTVLAVTGADKEPSADFLMDLTRSQLLLLIETAINGDGHDRGDGQRTFYQVAESGVAAFEMACALAGLPTNSGPQKDYGNRYGRPPHRVSILRSGVSRPLDAIRVKAYGYKDGESRTPAIDEWVDHDGIVWCPTTPSGTWLARRNGAVYFTGNSVGYQVPKGKALIKSGIRHITEMDLYEYSPVLFGAMPHARTETSVKDAQEAWIEVKADIFGTCEDGSGTCCLSCGAHAEAKADDPEIDDRWVVEFESDPEAMPSVVGTFASKAMAESWLEIYDGDEVGQVKAVSPENERAIASDIVATGGDEGEPISDEEAFADLEILDDKQRSELLALAAAEGVDDDAVIARLAVMIAENSPGHVVAGALAARVALAPEEGEGMSGVEKPGQSLAEARKQGAVGGKAKGKSVEDLLLEIKALATDDEGEIKEADMAAVADFDPISDAEAENIVGLMMRDFMGPEDESKAYTFNPDLHPRAPDGKFAPRGVDGAASLAKPRVSGTPGVGGLTADAVIRAAQHVDRRTVPTRKLRRAIGRRFAPNWNTRAAKVEAILARAQNRKASKSLAVLAATLGNATENLAPSERRAFIEDDLGISLEDLRAKAVAELRSSGATPTFVRRVENNIDRSVQRQLGGRQKKDGLPIDLDPDFADVMAEAALNLKVASMTVDEVYEEMAAMDAKSLEELIEAVEGKVDEANPAGEARARHLIRWFEHGEGATKIRWGTSGDFMRCVRIASKHMTPEQAKGFCNKRHTGAVGRPPGQGHKGDDVELEPIYRGDDEQKALFEEWLGNDEWTSPVDLDVDKKSAEEALAEDMEQKDFCFGCDVQLVDSACPSCETSYDVKGLRRFVESMVRRNPDGEFAPKGSSGGKLQNAKTTVSAVARTRQDRKGPKAGDWNDTLKVLNDMAKDRGSLLHYMVDKEMAKRSEGGPGMEVDVHGPSGSITGRLGEVEPFQDALGLLRRVAEHNANNDDQGAVHIDLTDGTVVMTKGRKKTRLEAKIKQRRDAKRRAAAAVAPTADRLDDLSAELDEMLRSGAKDDNVEPEIKVEGYALAADEIDLLRARVQLITLDVR